MWNWVYGYEKKQHSQVMSHLVKRIFIANWLERLSLWIKIILIYRIYWRISRTICKVEMNCNYFNNIEIMHLKSRRYLKHFQTKTFKYKWSTLHRNCSNERKGIKWGRKKETVRTSWKFNLMDFIEIFCRSAWLSGSERRERRSWWFRK